MKLEIVVWARRIGFVAALLLAVAVTCFPTRGEWNSFHLTFVWLGVLLFFCSSVVSCRWWEDANIHPDKEMWKWFLTASAGGFAGFISGSIAPFLF
jgi:hypothetical protein